MGWWRRFKSKWARSRSRRLQSSQNSSDKVSSRKSSFSSTSRRYFSKLFAVSHPREDAENNNNDGSTSVLLLQPVVYQICKNCDVTTLKSLRLANKVYHTEATQELKRKSTMRLTGTFYRRDMKKRKHFMEDMKHFLPHPNLILEFPFDNGHVWHFTHPIPLLRSLFRFFTHELEELKYFRVETSGDLIHKDPPWIWDAVNLILRSHAETLESVEFSRGNGRNREFLSNFHILRRASYPFQTYLGMDTSKLYLRNVTSFSWTSNGLIDEPDFDQIMAFLGHGVGGLLNNSSALIEQTLRSLSSAMPNLEVIRVRIDLPAEIVKLFYNQLMRILCTGHFQRLRELGGAYFVPDDHQTEGGPTPIYVQLMQLPPLQSLHIFIVSNIEGDEENFHHVRNVLEKQSDSLRELKMQICSCKNRDSTFIVKMPRLKALRKLEIAWGCVIPKIEFPIENDFDEENQNTVIGRRPPGSTIDYPKNLPQIQELAFRSVTMRTLGEVRSLLLPFAPITNVSLRPEVVCDMLNLLKLPNWANRGTHEGSVDYAFVLSLTGTFPNAKIMIMEPSTL